jgi:hypothetical protein
MVYWLCITTEENWKVIKWGYNILPSFLQKALIALFTPVIFVAKFVVTGKNPLKMKRGMDFMHNVIDWIGNLPLRICERGRGDFTCRTSWL